MYMYYCCLLVGLQYVLIISTQVVEDVPYVTKLETLDDNGCDFCAHGGNNIIVKSILLQITLLVMVILIITLKRSKIKKTKRSLIHFDACFSLIISR